MTPQVNLAVFFDYTCPYCYIANIRLQKVKAKYGDTVQIDYKSYPLGLRENRTRKLSDQSLGNRARASMMEPDAPFKPWPDNEYYTGGSLPALEAAKCAQLQGEELYNRYHMALFYGLFSQCRNISDTPELVKIAWECGLDVDRFAQDFISYEQRVAVMEDFKLGLAVFSRTFFGVPTVIFDGFFPLAGAHPVENYCKVIDKLLVTKVAEQI